MLSLTLLTVVTEKNDNSYQPFSIEQPWKHREYSVRFIWVVDEILSILKGLFHLLQDDFSVTGVVHQRYDLFATLFMDHLLVLYVFLSSWPQVTSFSELS